MLSSETAKENFFITKEHYECAVGAKLVLESFTANLTFVFRTLSVELTTTQLDIHKARQEVGSV